MENALDSNDASSESSSVISGISEFNEKNSTYRFSKYEFVVGSRINSKLLYTIDENQFYRFNKNNKNGAAYLCAEDSCKSRVHIRKENLCIQQEKYYEHKHETKEKKYKELCVKYRQTKVFGHFYFNK